jgi:hypothetical protein
MLLDILVAHKVAVCIDYIIDILIVQDIDVDIRDFVQRLVIVHSASPGSIPVRALGIFQNSCKTVKLRP